MERRDSLIDENSKLEARGVMGFLACVVSRVSTSLESS